MSEKNRNRAADPMALWRQWYETSARLWSEMFAGGRRNFIDPYGFYRQWFKSLENARERVGETTRTSPTAAVNPATSLPGSTITGQIPAEARAAEAQNLWKQWFEMATVSWQKAATLGTEAASLAPRWIEMLEQIRHNLFSAEGYPTDPLQFTTRLYNATSGPLSEFVGDIIQREEFLEASNSFMQSYTSFYKVFRRDSEKYLKNLQIPVRSDITRVAGLVVALEDKIDRLEEAFEDDYARPATAEAVGGIEDRVKGLEKRLEGVEGKIDKLLITLENAPQNGDAQAEAVQEDSQADGEVRATAAARRKARELGVELSEVEGTGLNDQITVDDVRRQNAREEGES